MRTGPTALLVDVERADTRGNERDAHVAARRDAPNWERGPAWYEDRFAGSDGFTARGEASPSYSQADIFPGVAERIASMLPDVRLVYVVRHPIERIRSMYLHQLASGRETRPISVALEGDSYYLNASRYAWQLDQHLEFVSAERVRVVTTDALRDDRQAILAGLFDFIGVDPFTVPIAEIRSGRTDQKRVAVPLKARLGRLPGYGTLRRVAPDPVRRAVERATTRPVSPAMAELPATLEAELIERLRPDLVRLRAFLGPEFDGWGLLEPS
jgi:hypothetical protein